MHSVSVHNLVDTFKEYGRLAKPESLRSALGGWLYRDTFRETSVFVFFVGYMRSGHTLVGSLLNAHPNIVVSHELGSLSYLARGYSLAQISYLCLKEDEKFERQNREWTGYKYRVDGQFQGEYQTLRVIGDKAGAAAVYNFKQHPELYDLLEDLDIDVRVIHHTRNPFDIITTGAQKGEEGMNHVQRVSTYFFNQARQVEQILERLSTIERVSVLTTHHEDMVKDTPSTVRDLVNFLGENASKSYLNSCDDLVFDSPKKTRFEADWSDSLVHALENQISNLKYFPKYIFSE